MLFHFFSFQELYEFVISPLLTKAGKMSNLIGFHPNYFWSAVNSADDYQLSTIIMMSYLEWMTICTDISELESQLSKMLACERVVKRIRRIIDREEYEVPEGIY